MRPSRLMVGEVRQEEWLDLTQSAWTNTGLASFRANRFLPLRLGVVTSP
jgi:Flp pilus assembly CpaF family ATPase